MSERSEFVFSNYFSSIAGVLVALLGPALVPIPAHPCGKPWIFFDLGNTLIEAAPGHESRYLPGAQSYIEELKKRGYPMGLITNIPEKWGNSQSTRIQALKKIVRETWTKDPSANEMNWNDFPESHIVVPPRDANRKPAPYLFRAALAAVTLEEGKIGCPVYFQGEDPLEVAAAEKVGMRGYIVRKDPNALYLPLSRLE